MGLLDILLDAQNGLQPTIDREMDNLYGFDGMMRGLGSPSPTAGPGGFAGNQGLGGMSETGALPQQNGVGSMDARDIVVEGFKPKKRSFLGFLADTFLLSKGGKPLFAERIRQKNVERALENFREDPWGAAARLNQVDGMQADALKLMGQLRDDDRLDAREDRMMGTAQERAMKSAAGLLGNVNEDGSNWPAIRTLYNQAMKRNGIDFELPEEFDPDLTGALYTGAIPPDKQQMNEYRQEMLKIRQKRLEQQGADTESRIKDREVRQGQGERSLKIRQQNADTARQNAGKGKGGKDGAPAKEGDTSLSPDGKTIKTYQNGKWHFFEVVNGKRGKYLGAK